MPQIKKSILKNTNHLVNSKRRKGSFPKLISEVKQI